MTANPTNCDSIPESLADLLSDCLPENVELKYYHISTPPSRCTPLFSPPPDTSSPDSRSKQARAQRTYCESHSLLLTLSEAHDDQIDGESQPSQVAVFAIEVQVYTTATLTTVFISKADSTGWLTLLANTPSRSSILKSVAATFVSWIIRQRHRPGRPLVLSLFARAQNQYLFPGSVDNGKKHVLDDRALVKWWCKTLDPILREYDPPLASGPLTSSKPESNGSSVRSKAHLIVPGNDTYETQAFYPQSFRLDPPSHKRWANTHPLRQIAPYPNAPPRCLVPHFPDDPKARFLQELDDELSTAPQPNRSASALKHESPTKRGKGQWRSVQTLEQFWDMMAFRQECSSGRLVGFLWITFTPVLPLPLSTNGDDISPPSSPSRTSTATKRSKQTPKKLDSNKHKSQRPRRSTFRTSRASKNTKSKYQQNWKKKKLKGLIPLRSPRVKLTGTLSSNDTNSEPTTTTHFHSPLSARGMLILTDKAYNRMHELFLRLDFKNLEASRASTRRWIQETSVVGTPNKVFSRANLDPSLVKTDNLGWGMTVRGRRKIDSLPTATKGAQPADSAVSSAGGVTTLTVKRKRKEPEGEVDVSTAYGDNVPTTNGAESVNVAGSKAEPQLLGALLVRKKAKLDSTDNKKASDTVVPATSVSQHVNVLDTGLVRKKPKS